MGIAIWLVPSRADASGIERIMHAPEPTSVEGTAKTSTTGSYPPFEPHITLASFPTPTPISQILSSIPAPSSIPRLNCSFASIEVGQVFFRSVYIAVEKSEELADLHRVVHEKIGMEEKTPSFPHVSLCYISDEDAGKGERDDYARRLFARDDLVQRSGADGKGVEFNLGDGGWQGMFIAKELWVVRCEGPIESWEPLEKIELVN